MTKSKLSPREPKCAQNKQKKRQTAPIFQESSSQRIDTNGDSMTSEYNLKLETKKSNLQKEWIAQRSQINTMLCVTFDVMAKGYMNGFKKLYEGVESWEIYQFLGDFSTLLWFLSLLIQEKKKPATLYERKRILDFQKTKSLSEPVPKTFLAGLLRMKEQSEKGSASEPIQITEPQIRNLYMASLLLIGVGEIGRKDKTKNTNETEQKYFHRMQFFLIFRVTYLLESSGFLTPKLFYYIRSNWGIAMQIVRSQNENEATEKKPINVHSKTSYLQKDQESRGMSEEKRKFKDRYSEQGERFYQDDFNDNDKVDYLLVQKRKFDQQETLISEESFQPKHEIHFQECNEREGKNDFKRDYTKFQLGEKACELPQKRVKLDYCHDPAIAKAKNLKQFNYMQAQTRKNRNKGNQKGEKRQRRATKKQQQAINSPISVESIQHSDDDNIWEEEGTQNQFGFFEDKKESYSFGGDDQIESLDLLVSSSLRCSSGDEEKSGSEQIIQEPKEQIEDEKDQIEEEKETRTGTEGSENGKKKRNSGDHQKREIDFMVSNIIEDRFVMIHAIANHIYHSLKSANFVLVPETQARGSQLKHFDYDIGKYFA